MVFIGEDLTSKEAVIHFIGEAAEKNGLVHDQEALVRAVMEREAQVSTSIGHRIAIPHGKSETIAEPFVAYVSVREPFEWDRATGDQVLAVFLIGVPAADAEMTHLKYISALSKQLVRDAFREALLDCREKDRALRLLGAERR